MATAWSTRVPPTPPSASGTDRPSTPSSPPSRAQTFGSNGGSDSMSCRTFSSAKWSALNLRTASRNWFCSSVNLYSATGDLLPRHARIGAQVSRQSEDPFTEDVAHDLGCAAFDGVGTAAKELLLNRPLPVPFSGSRALLITAVQKSFGPKEIHAPLIVVLIQLRPYQLADRSFRTWTSDRGGGARAFRGEPLRL